MKNKKTIKRAIALTCALTAASSAFALVGCKKSVPDTEQTLEVHLWKAGYGTKFCSDLLDAFKQESWVKEKYPDLQIVFTSDGDKSIYTTKIDAGERANTVDLFLTASLGTYVGEDNSGYEYFADLTEEVYNKEVPGETGVTVYDKMLPSYIDSIRYYERGQDSSTPNVPFKSYVFPWASGMDSILYNATFLDAIHMEVPLTTKQFIETCEDIAGGSAFDYNRNADGDYAIMTDSSGNYWHYLYPTWWGQYEGIENYYNFFNGVIGSRYDYKVHEQKGKLYALQVLEKTLAESQGFVYKNYTGNDFMTAQTEFLSGNGVFYSNGDWFALEMKEKFAQVKEHTGKEYNIRMMKMPIVSEIIEKTPSIESEEALRAVIRAIDAGFVDIDMALEANFEGLELVTNVTKQDYQKIVEARSITHAIGSLHQAGVPSYAKGKQIAFDFLRFMATDKAQEIYLKATEGASLPFEYNVKEKNPTLYNSFSQIQKDRLDMVYDSVHGMTVLPDPGSFALVKWGNMSEVKSLEGQNIWSYFTQGGKAINVYNSDIQYYKTEFETCLQDAGLGGTR